MRFRREDEENFAMEMTPLIDVVFLLIIFFMVSTVFVEFNRHMEINLPTKTVDTIKKMMSKNTTSINGVISIAKLSSSSLLNRKLAPEF